MLSPSCVWFWNSHNNPDIARRDGNLRHVGGEQLAQEHTTRRWKGGFSSPRSSLPFHPRFSRLPPGRICSDHLFSSGSPCSCASDRPFTCWYSGLALSSHTFPQEISMRPFCSIARTPGDSQTHTVGPDPFLTFQWPDCCARLVTGHFCIFGKWVCTLWPVWTLWGARQMRPPAHGILCFAGRAGPVSNACVCMNLQTGSSSFADLLSLPWACTPPLFCLSVDTIITELPLISTSPLRPRIPVSVLYTFWPPSLLFFTLAFWGQFSPGTLSWLCLQFYIPLSLVTQKPPECKLDCTSSLLTSSGGPSIDLSFIVIDLLFVGIHCLWLALPHPLLAYSMLLVTVISSRMGKPSPSCMWLLGGQRIHSCSGTWTVSFSPHEERVSPSRQATHGRKQSWVGSQDRPSGGWVSEFTNTGNQLYPYNLAIVGVNVFPVLESQCCHLLAMWLWANYLTFLHFNFLTSKMDKKITPIS